MYTHVVCTLYSCYIYAILYLLHLFYTGVLYSYYIYTLYSYYSYIYRFLSGYVAGAGILQQCGAATEAGREPQDAGMCSV